MPRPVITSAAPRRGRNPRVGTQAAAGTADEASLEQLAVMLDRGDCEIVAIGRSLLANPDWGDTVAAEGAAGLKPYDREAVEVLY